MDRKEFLSSMGLGAASLAVMSCFGCGKGSNATNSSTSAPTGVDFTLDLTASANAALTSNGGYLISHGILVARTSSGAYIAVQESCTHENYPLVYQGGSKRFYCNNHGATFTEKGAVTGGPTSRSLAVYNTTLAGTSLRIYS
ncbi:QcrA and Rieske domain-containing protein [Mucilaginibacter psychrotolerans]|uniref:Rieske (2Fe-2S) protein n=1 Tax=Mucilaginibacter psychrotolerans TaxID=1524096 RepID=A0A4Y8SCQ7_9SPHI|nr:Rieske 2Fe-2S domain-containing protein [Mucilaginibacter psychrotolerans]TFF36380.1 Rieske (2Fe-2S) protein [Mucilaginibacter psychrotolerans]